MSLDGIGYLIYLAPLALIWLAYVRNRQKQHRASVDTYRESQEAGLVHPASLHPVIDLHKCIGCESCISVCPEMPEHQVLGMVRRKATLVSPTDCIGHGACKTVCPVDAISLVFGTAERGVDIPELKPNFESNVPGIFIAGELGGMGLIRNAIEQGRQAMEAIASRPRDHTANGLHVLIVGAGPTGISASLAAKQHGLNYLTIEQGALGGTVANFPRRKLVMTSPAELPLIGKVKFRETTKEKLIEFWTAVCTKTQLRIKFGERLESVTKQGSRFLVKTTKQEYTANSLLLCPART
jgi:thioredoxin reductase (NADPH)